MGSNSDSKTPTARERADRLVNSDCYHNRTEEDAARYPVASDCPRCIEAEILATERTARAEGFAEGISSMQAQQRDECNRAAMRALMVLVHDEIISSDRAREIVGMTHEEQRAFWRSEHREAMRSARAEGFREGQERARAGAAKLVGSFWNEDTLRVLDSIDVVRAIEAMQCHVGYGDEGGRHRCRYQDERDALAKRIEAAVERLSPTAMYLGAPCQPLATAVIRILRGEE